MCGDHRTQKRAVVLAHVWSGFIVSDKMAFSCAQRIGHGRGMWYVFEENKNLTHSVKQHTNPYLGLLLTIEDSAM